MFSTDQIETVLRANINFHNFNYCTRISGGYSKYSYKIFIDEKQFIFQILKNPDDISGQSNITGLDYLYPGGTKNNLESKKILEELKILTPEIIFYDDSKNNINFDCVLQEFIEFDSFTGFEGHKRKNTLKECLFNFGLSLGSLKNYKRSIPGDLSTFDNIFIPHKIVYSVTCDYLDISPDIPFVSNNKEKIKDTLRGLTENIIPRNTFYLIHSDFKPDNFRFDRNGNIYWIDFESLQYFDIEFELAQFIVPDFMITNDECFKKGYSKAIKFDIDWNRLLLYQIFRCISQIVNCSSAVITENNKELNDKIIESNIQLLEALINDKNKQN